MPRRFCNEEVFEKLRHFCAWQERCLFDVRQKIKPFGLDATGTEALIARLVENGLLNEERFAVSFARGRSRLKSWGREKIRQALRQRGISHQHITIALRELDTSEYARALAQVASRKWEALAGEKNLAIRKQKLHRHLCNKGYESRLAWQHIRDEILGVEG